MQTFSTLAAIQQVTYLTRFTKTSYFRSTLLFFEHILISGVYYCSNLQSGCDWPLSHEICRMTDGTALPGVHFQLENIPACRIENNPK